MIETYLLGAFLMLCFSLYVYATEIFAPEIHVERFKEAGFIFITVVLWPISAIAIVLDFVRVWKDK